MCQLDPPGTASGGRVRGLETGKTDVGSWQPPGDRFPDSICPGPGIVATVCSFRVLPEGGFGGRWSSS